MRREPQGTRALAEMFRLLVADDVHNVTDLNHVGCEVRLARLPTQARDSLHRGKRTH